MYLGDFQGLFINAIQKNDKELQKKLLADMSKNTPLGRIEHDCKSEL